MSRTAFLAAADAYATIRASRSDVAAIARATGYKAANIEKVKRHLFLDAHWLDRYVHLGVPAVRARFDPDPEIAAAWTRLQAGAARPSDLALLRHEMAEAWYMRRVDRSYGKAHNAAQRRFPAPEW